MRVLGLGVLAAGLTFATACKDDDDIVDTNEEELITTVTITLVSSSAPVTLTFRDLDGPGGNAPTIAGGTLDPNKTYTYSVSFLNEQESPPENITSEVFDEGDEHQVFLRASGVNLTTTYGDVDVDGRPIGLTGTVQSGAASTGTLTVTLRHELNKAADGVAAGNIANAGGETDVEVAFPVTVR